VNFDRLAGTRVLIIGGRQSAYEWAALIRGCGADRIDVVHRHDVSRFERVSWKFVDPHVERTLTVRGYWRNLPKQEKEAIANRFWEVGRLTLEYWLTPRLEWDGITRWPGAHVTDVTDGADEAAEVVLSNSARLEVDYVVFACGYRVDLKQSPLSQRRARPSRARPRLPGPRRGLSDDAEGALPHRLLGNPGLGPFFGFVKGSPAAATIIVRHLLCGSDNRSGAHGRAAVTT